MELRRYLILGIDLQHRRLERTRYLASTGEPYQKQYEERVKGSRTFTISASTRQSSRYLGHLADLFLRRRA